MCDRIIADYISDEKKISQEVIDTLTKPVFSLIDSEEVRDYLYSLCKNLLQYAKDKHYSQEMAYAINLNTLNFVGRAFGDSRTIDITELVKVMKDTKDIFLVLHNHPSNNSFSPRDLNTFFDTPNMAILVVIGNAGAIYVIEKNRAIDEIEYREIKKIVINYRTNTISFEEAISKLMNYGITYNKF